jgi:hypothetical protein
MQECIYLAHMSPAELIKAIETRGERVGLTPAELARRAEVHPTTWWRIREDRHKPQFGTWERLQKLHKDLRAA